MAERLNKGKHRFFSGICSVILPSFVPNQNRKSGAFLATVGSARPRLQAFVGLRKRAMAQRSIQALSQGQGHRKGG